MRVLCTFPGRAGDLLWALPTVRAISERFGVPVDLVIAGEFSGMLELLTAQPYIASAWADPAWGLSAEHSWEPPVPGLLAQTSYDRVFHLGYRRWPEQPLPVETYLTATMLMLGEEHGAGLLPLDLRKPWITAVPSDGGCPWLAHTVVGWSDTYFELKWGLTDLLGRQGLGPERTGLWGSLLPPPGSRWVTEGQIPPVGWMEAASRIAAADIFLGDCSALHVLAVALGTPVIIYEPMEARHNPIFYPCGWDGRQVTIVKGLDGKPTTDSRHTHETIELIRARRHAQK